MQPGQFPSLDQEVQFVSAETLKRRLDGGEQVTLLDTRRPADFAEWQIEHPNLEAVNVPFTAFLEDDEPADTVPEGVPQEPLVTCCAKGISSTYVAEFLAREGWSVEALDDGMRAWARLYEAVDVAAEPLVRQYHRPSSGCLSYLVVSDDEAAVVDPLRAFTERYVEDADALGADITIALDTHVHADHVSGVRSLREQTGCTVALPAGARDRGLEFGAELYADGDEMAVGTTVLEAVALPGHTSEMSGIFVAGTTCCVGDSVFLESVARPDLEDPEAARDAAATLHETLQSLQSWDGDVRICPGHTSPGDATDEAGGYTASVETLRSTLPAFEMDRDAFVEYAVADLPPRPSDYETIIETNLGRAAVDDEAAFELELGPNNCAADG